MEINVFISGKMGKYRSVLDEYMQTPERVAGIIFELSLREMSVGSTKVCWGDVNFV